jgi:hypothetical protein
MKLYQADKKKAYFDVLKASADALWNLARDPSDDLFSVDWAGPPMEKSDNPQQSAACMALSLFAQESGDYPGSKKASNTYEAEDASLDRIGVEATHKGFQGWGYLAGWDADGQSVEFAVDARSAGRHQVTLRYSAGAGDAVRLIRVNGAVAFDAMKFPNTKSWDEYRTVSFEVPLQKGKNVITILFDSARGGENYLNLDNLTIH